jgi:hypothetical protein
MTVFANSLEVACKAQANKVIAAFPDTCFTPPQTPATPPGVPIPYPSFGMDSDTESGTGTVFIGGKTVSQKNKSYYSKTSGTEAGCAPKKNVITSVNTGKEYAHAWSSDVKMDGEPVSRFSDISSNDHASPTGGTPPFPKIGTPGIGAAPDVEDCLVGTYDEIVKKCNAKGGEAHHIVPDKCFRTGTRAQAEAGTSPRIANAPSLGGGVCICLDKTPHKELHDTERANLNALGKKVAEGKTGAALDAAKKTAAYGTADVGDIHAACQDSLDSLNPTGDETIGECIEIAKQEVEKQSDSFASGQTGRTSNALPNPAASKKMIP